MFLNIPFSKLHTIGRIEVVISKTAFISLVGIVDVVDTIAIWLIEKCVLQT
jgi:hypothetical protein